jgi:1,4-alpha-glucan branching enzyme
LFELDDEPEGFRWIDCNDAPHSVIAFVRFPSFLSGKGRRIVVDKGVHVVAVCNFTPVPRFGYRIGVPRRSPYLERLNTDAAEYGGSGMGNLGKVAVEDVPSHGFPQSVVLTLPPLSTIWLVPELVEDPLPASSGPRSTLPPGADPLVVEAPVAIPRDATIDRSIADESTLVSFDRRSSS